LKTGEPDENTAPEIATAKKVISELVGTTVSFLTDKQSRIIGTFATVGVAPDKIQSVETAIVLVPARLTGHPAIRRTVAIETVVAGATMYMIYLL
jgi:hypothetical protein